MCSTCVERYQHLDCNLWNFATDRAHEVFEIASHPLQQQHTQPISITFLCSLLHWRRSLIPQTWPNFPCDLMHESPPFAAAVALSLNALRNREKYEKVRRSSLRSSARAAMIGAESHTASGAASNGDDASGKSSGIFVFHLRSQREFTSSMTPLRRCSAINARSSLAEAEAVASDAWDARLSHRWFSWRLFSASFRSSERKIARFSWTLKL